MRVPLLCLFLAGCQFVAETVEEAAEWMEDAQTTSRSEDAPLSVEQPKSTSGGRPPTAETPRHKNPGPRSLRIATWNMEWLSATPGAGEVKRTKEDYAELRAMVKRLDADVIALQEVAGEKAAKMVFDARNWQFHFEDRRDPQRVGFAIRRSVAFRANPDLKDLSLGDFRMRRGADISVRVGGQELRLLTIHLKAGCKWDDLATTKTPACDTLRRQRDVLETWIEARGKSGVPFAVVGDFNRNFHRDETFWPLLDDGAPPSSDVTDLRFGKRERCRSTKRTRPVDHFVLSNKALGWVTKGSVKVVDYPTASERLPDHCPLVAELAPSSGRP